jgi:hypothetical protein
MSRIVYRDMPDMLCGFFDSTTDQIIINRRQTRRKKRVTVIHESIHRDFNHGPAKSLAENLAREIVVERMTARFVISLPELMRVMSQTTSLDVAADRLDVDLQCLVARLLGLDSAERIFFNVCVMQCIRVKSAMAMAAVSHVMSMAPLS